MRTITISSGDLDRACLLAIAIRDLAWLGSGAFATVIDDKHDQLAALERQQSLLRALDVLAVQLHDELDAVQQNSMGFLDPLRKARREAA